MKAESIPVSRKVLVLENIFLTAAMIFICATIMLAILGRKLLLGNIVISPTILGRLTLICSTIYFIFVRKRSSAKPKVGKIRVITTIIVILLSMWLIADELEGTIAEKGLKFLDGKKVLMIEKHCEDKFYDKYIQIYQKGFLTCIDLGKIDEHYYSNTCLLQNKYSYDYDTQSKILLIDCEYGTWGNGVAILTHDTGSISTEFQLK